MKVVSLNYLKRHYIFYNVFNEWVKWEDHEVTSRCDHCFGVVVYGHSLTGNFYTASAYLCCGEYEDITDIEKC